MSRAMSRPDHIPEQSTITNSRRASMEIWEISEVEEYIDYPVLKSHRLKKRPSLYLSKASMKMYRRVASI